MDWTMAAILPAAGRAFSRAATTGFFGLGDSNSASALASTL